MEEDNLDRKIFGAIGRYRKHHMSNIQGPKSALLFNEPGRRGFFTMDSIQPGKVYDVYCTGSGCIGRMDYNTIHQKFGRL